MDSKTSSSSSNVPQEPSNPDEFFMQQSLLFSENLKDLKNLRKQLNSAADYFELSYYKEDQKQLVVETLKDYAIKALISTVDHLGSVAFKVNTFLDQKISEVSETELRISCIEQRMLTCREYINRGGLFQQSSATRFPKHHKQYIFPGKFAEESMDSISKSYNADHNLPVLKTAVQATIKGTPPPFFSRERQHSAPLYSPQFYMRRETFTLPRSTNNRKPATSPQQFPLIRSGSLLKKPTSPNYPMTKRRYPSEPRRSVSLSVYPERDRGRESEPHSGKSKHLFKAFLSMSKSRKESSRFKYLDEI